MAAAPAAASVTTPSSDPSARFKRLYMIGSGSFGSVYAATDLSNNTTVAIKVISLEDTDDSIDTIRAEITALMQCQSAYITRYITSYIIHSQLHIVMEHLHGGSVEALMQDLPPATLTESIIQVVIRDVVTAISYLHSHSLIHRDIKCANVLLSANGDVKLADFGVSGILTATIDKRHTLVGTPYWMAPEVIRQDEYDESADIWSIGITVMEMFNGHPPLHHLHPMKALFLIPKNDPPILDNPRASKLARDFVKVCLVKDASQRANIQSLLKHKWLTSTLTQSTQHHRELKTFIQNVLVIRSQQSSSSVSQQSTVTNHNLHGTSTIVENGTGMTDWVFTMKTPNQSASALSKPAPISTVRYMATSQSDRKSISPNYPDADEDGDATVVRARDPNAHNYRELRLSDAFRPATPTTPTTADNSAASTVRPTTSHQLSVPAVYASPNSIYQTIVSNNTIPESPQHAGEVQSSSGDEAESSFDSDELSSRSRPQTVAHRTDTVRSTKPPPPPPRSPRTPRSATKPSQPPAPTRSPRSSKAAPPASPQKPTRTPTRPATSTVRSPSLSATSTSAVAPAHNDMVTDIGAVIDATITRLQPQCNAATLILLQQLHQVSAQLQSIQPGILESFIHQSHNAIQQQKRKVSPLLTAQLSVTPNVHDHDTMRRSPTPTSPSAAALSSPSTGRCGDDENEDSQESTGTVRLVHSRNGKTVAAGVFEKNLKIWRQKESQKEAS